VRTEPIERSRGSHNEQFLGHLDFINFPLIGAVHDSLEITRM
jgi:hypothetical protein